MPKFIDDDRYTFGSFSTHMENPKNYTFLDDYPFRDKDRLETLKLLEARNLREFIPNATDPDLPDEVRLYVLRHVPTYVLQVGRHRHQKNSASSSSSFFIRFSTGTSWT